MICKLMQAPTFRPKSTRNTEKGKERDKENQCPLESSDLLVALTYNGQEDEEPSMVMKMRRLSVMHKSNRNDGERCSEL